MSLGKWRPFCLGLNVLKHIEAGTIWLTFSDNIFKLIFWVNIKISLSYDPKSPINNKPALV